MAKWKASEVWHTTVDAKDETRAMRTALEVFLNTESEHGAEFDYTTLAVTEVTE